MKLLIKKSRLILSLLVILLIFLLTFSFFNGKTEEDITINVIKENLEYKPEIIKEETKESEVYFCPADDCEKQLIKFIEDSKYFVHCAFFDLDLENVINALKEKEKEIDVKIVVDKDNEEPIIGIPFVKTDTRSAFMHNKFCISDYEKILTGSFNPTKRGAYFNNNNMIIIHSTYLSRNYEKEFLEFWNNLYGQGGQVTYPLIYVNNKKIENYFCPEDNCAEKIEKIINQSEESIFFMTFSFTHNGIATEMVKKIHEGIEVKGIFEKKQNSQYSKYKLLKFQGADVKFDNNKYNMHNKVIIIDNKIVITGSFNPSKNADERNDENIVIIHDETIAEKYINEFNYIWDYKEKLDLQPRNRTSIVLYEVFYDGIGNDKDKEYVKIYNPSNKKIDITNYFLYDNKTNFILKDTINPWDYSIVTRDNGLFTLKNSKGILILKDKFGKQIDFVAWEGLWNLKADEGYELKRNSTQMVNSQNQWIIEKIE